MELERGIERPRAPIVGERIYAHVIGSPNRSPLKDSSRGLPSRKDSDVPRRITSAQLRSKIQQAESKRRQAINDYNRRVREHNSKVRRAVDTHNRDVRQYNANRKRAVQAIDREIRAHNSRVRANQARLQSARTTFVSGQLDIGHLLKVRRSATELSAAYDRLDHANADPYMSDLAERETANSLTVVNNLYEDTDTTAFLQGDISSTKITTELSNISDDLNDRWLGAIYALNPSNPEATRHFCTSSREIIASILNTAAPNKQVLAQVPDCEVTKQGTPTRREKIRFCLHRLGVADDDLESFIDINVRDLNTLFTELNAGSHGPSGKFTSQQLTTVRTRVEDAIIFVSEFTPL